MTDLNATYDRLCNWYVSRVNACETQQNKLDDLKPSLGRRNHAILQHRIDRETWHLGLQYKAAAWPLREALGLENFTKRED